jgi:hypothetical protein
MKRILVIAAVTTTLAGAGWVAAETAAPAPKAHHGAGADPGSSTPDHKMGDCEMMGHGMGMGMGLGMMGGGMGPLMMGGADTAVTVKNTDKGVTITLSSNDPAAVKRLQKTAEAMRLMHEAMSQ